MQAGACQAACLDQLSLAACPKPYCKQVGIGKIGSSPQLWHELAAHLRKRSRACPQHTCGRRAGSRTAAVAPQWLGQG